MDTIGKRIEAIAERKGLPIGSELAARLGVKYESLRKWRQGLAGPSRRRQEVIASCRTLFCCMHVFVVAHFCPHPTPGQRGQRWKHPYC